MESPFFHWTAVASPAGTGLLSKVAEEESSGISKKDLSCVKNNKHISMLNPATVTELAKLFSFLGNEQRLNILKAITHEEKFAREISEEVGISRPLVNIYLKQFEKAGLVIGTNRVGEEPPYLKRYYKAVPFEFAFSLDLISKLGDE